MRLRWIGMAVILCGLVALLASCGSSSSGSSSGNSGGSASGSSASKAPLTYLMIGDFTGPAKAINVPHLIAAQAAAAYLNAHGGIDGHKLLVHSISDNSDSTTAVSEFIKYMSAGNHVVDCECGEQDDLPALLPVLPRYGVFEVNGSDNASQCVTDAATKCPNTWFIYPQPDVSQVELSTWMRQRGVKKVGLLLESMAFTTTEANHFDQVIKGSGMASTTVSFPPTAVDLTPQMQQLKAAGVQTVYVLGLGPPVGYALKARAALGWNVPLVVDVAGASTDITKLAPAADVKNAYEEIMWNEYPKSKIPGLPLMLQYAKPFGDITQGGASPNDNPAVSWDAVMTVKDAVVAAGGATSAKALDAALMKLPAVDPVDILTHEHGWDPTSHAEAKGTASDFVIVPVGPLANGQVQAP